MFNCTIFKALQLPVFLSSASPTIYLTVIQNAPYHPSFRSGLSTGTGANSRCGIFDRLTAPRLEHGVGIRELAGFRDFGNDLVIKTCTQSLIYGRASETDFIKYC